MSTNATDGLAWWGQSQLQVQQELYNALGELEKNPDPDPHSAPWADSLSRQLPLDFPSATKCEAFVKRKSARCACPSPS
jgi:hypothetical protein